MGPPLTIDFTPQSSFVVDMDEYESAKPPPRHPMQMRIDDGLRLHILERSGFTLTQVVNVIVENRKIQAQRNETIQSSLHIIRMERISRAMRRKLPSLQKIQAKSYGNMSNYCSNVKIVSGNSGIPMKRSVQSDNLKALSDDESILQQRTYAPKCAWWGSCRTLFNIFATRSFGIFYIADFRLWFSSLI